MNTEKLRQRDSEIDQLKLRLMETERRQRDRSREVDKLSRDNEEMRRQLELLTSTIRVESSEIMQSTSES